MPTLYAPTDELVAQSWLKSVPELASVPVATTLPAQTSWESSPTFLQIQVVPLGLPPHPNFPSHNPRILVSCWAKPKRWADAADLSQLVRAGVYAPDSARPVNLRTGYASARVLSIQMLEEPNRVTGDANELARYDFHLLMEWI